MRPDEHYCIPPLSRLDQGKLLTPIRQKRYFVLHAPRQTGKTSALLALRDLLNGGAEGAYRCVDASVEAGQAARENRAEAMHAILGEVARRADLTLGDASLDDLWPGILEKLGPNGALQELLSRWARASLAAGAPDRRDPRADRRQPAVGAAPASRGYDERPAAFPESVMLCGVRDDATIASTPAAKTPSSRAAVPSTSKPNRCGWVTSRRRKYAPARPAHRRDRPAVDRRGASRRLRAQRSAVAGKRPGLSGQPARPLWTRPRPPANRDAVHTACEQLILRRDTHLDQLTDKLQEERVQRVARS